MTVGHASCLPERAAERHHAVRMAQHLVPRPEAAYALLARGAQGATALFAFFCVAWAFRLEEQGLFFVFLSLGTLVQLGEFGLTYAVMQTASMVAASGAAAQMAEFRHQARRIGVCLLSLAAVCVGGLGAFMLAGHAAVSWAGPWLAFVVAVAVAQFMQLELALIEGSGLVTVAWRLRFMQEGLGGCAFVMALLGGAGLWSLCIYWGARAALAWAWLGASDSRQVPMPAGRRPFSWRLQVWPFQWRMGLSGLSGFLIFQAFNPILLMTQGSGVAATFGMSLALMNMLLLLTTAWPLSQAARYGHLLTLRQFDVLEIQFRRMWIRSLALAGIAVAVLLSILLWIGAHQPLLAARLADMQTTATLLAAALVHHATACFAVLLRAERREPLLTVTVVGGLLGVIALWFVAHHGIARDIALTHLAFTLIGLLIVLQKYRRFGARHRLAARGSPLCPPPDPAGSQLP